MHLCYVDFQPDADYQDYKTQDSRYISMIGGLGWGEGRGGGCDISMKVSQPANLSVTITWRWLLQFKVKL